VVSNQTDSELAEAMAAEIQRKQDTDNMELVLRPFSVLQLVGLVQLALRHPGVSQPLRETAEKFIGGAREYFADSPAVLETIERGSDPQYDTPETVGEKARKARDIADLFKKS